MSRGVKRSSARSKSSVAEPKDKLLTKLTSWFFARPRFTAALWVVILVFGILSYTTLLKREGFPSIAFPFSVINGTYLVNDPAVVDEKVAKPLSQLILEQGTAKTVQTQSFANFFVVTVQYKDGTDAAEATKQIETIVKTNNTLPPQANAQFTVPKFGFTERGDDIAISIYAKSGEQTTETLTARAEQAATFLKSQEITLAKDISVINPYQEAINPLTGQMALTQKNFDRFGQRVDDKNEFTNSVIIGITRANGADILKLNDQVEKAVAALNQQSDFQGNQATISASFAPQIRDQVSELQKVLLEGLIAVLVVGTIVIAFRASIITVISMITVLAATVGLLYAVGYTLNTITLFALILGLSLIVDDTIIMVEAIDAQRRRQKQAKDAVRTATRKVSRAMVAATLTAALSFAPLLFVGGILGGFIRAIPATIISALLISLFVALIFIPLFARYLLLGKKQMGDGNVKEVAAGIEAKLARFISAPMLWAKHSRKKLVFVGLTAVLIGFGFIAAGGAIAKYVEFNIFPSDKDSNAVTVNLAFPPLTTIQQAQATAARADKIVGETVGDNFVQASYLATGSAQGGSLRVDLVGYAERDVRSPEIVRQLEKAFDGFQGARVAVQQQSAGPPPSAFEVRIETTDRENGLAAAHAIATYLETTELKRPDGTKPQIKTVTVTNSDVLNRKNSTAYVSVTAEFVDSDTTTLVTLAKAAVESKFTASELAKYQLKTENLSFDFGQEDENQDSFATLALAFPAVLAVIYVLLAVQFRSFLQPLLIFMAIPFSFFGIAFGLKITDNPFSFFAMLGFFALIGLSIKNTILLTDYCNQARRAGMHPVDAAHEALAERFRPLVATSLTAVVSLIPLALTSPFWEGLAVVLIFGLLSSTLLVLTVFPYYYLGAEFLRTRRWIRRKKA